MAMIGPNRMNGVRFFGRHRDTLPRILGPGLRGAAIVSLLALNLAHGASGSAKAQEVVSSSSSSSSSPLEAQVAKFNSLPDANVKLTVADDRGSDAAIPVWARDLPMTLHEAGALVALAGAFAVGTGPASPRPKRYSVPEWIAGSLVAGATETTLRRSNGVAPHFTSEPINPYRPRTTSINRGETVLGNLARLDTCVGAFASLSQKLQEKHPDSRLAQLARWARTERLELATKLSPDCAN